MLSIKYLLLLFFRGEKNVKLGQFFFLQLPDIFVLSIAKFHGLNIVAFELKLSKILSKYCSLEETRLTLIARTHMKN